MLVRRRVTDPMNDTSLDKKKQKKSHQVLRELFAFVLKPDIERATLSSGKKTKRTLKLYLYKLVITTLLIVVIDSLLGIENKGLNTFTTKYSAAQTIFYGALLIPVVEEVIFRLSLRGKPLYFAITTALLAFYGISKHVYDIPMLEIDSSLPERILLSVPFGFLVFVLSKKYMNRIDALWKNSFRWLFYVSSILFGFYHILNFDIGLSNFYLLPILTLPNVISGFFFGFVRMKYGFLYGLMFHCFNNFIALSLSLVL